MTEVPKKIDTRVRRTKLKLLRAFKKMLSQVPFEDISVNALCELAGVRRATFYKHFEDKFAFLKYFIQILREEFDKLVWKHSKPDATSDYYLKYLEGIFAFVDEHEKMINMTLQSEIFPSILTVIQSQNYIDTCDRLQKSIDQGMKLCASVEAVASMLTGGITHIVLNWLYGGKKESIEELTEEVKSIIKALTAN